MTSRIALALLAAMVCGAVPVQAQPAAQTPVAALPTFAIGEVKQNLGQRPIAVQGTCTGVTDMVANVNSVRDHLMGAPNMQLKYNANNSQAVMFIVPPQYWWYVQLKAPGGTCTFSYFEI